ncbi:TetR/AcrR family transcriptional regulator [Arthrobacter castelli]|uniref:TetR/AcrR family transcriptional regulator n=1 Tax=Arthrobacter castelli TaxID=271431 RepID=UPI0006851D5F|nr:TetR/AcrR family transcriptional regulator [Arthrobacter castelli]
MGVRAEQRDKRLRDVREATWRLFQDQGYESTTVRQIATKANVATGTVMNFGGKETLLLALFETAIAEHMEPSPRQDATAVDAVWHHYKPYFDFYASVPELARSYGRILLSPAARGHPALGSQARDFNTLVARDISNRHPLAPENDAARMAEALFGLYIHALVAWVSSAATLDEATASFRQQIAWQLARFDNA